MGEIFTFENICHEIIVLCNLALLIFLGKKYVGGMVAKVFTDRRAATDTLYSDAEKAVTDAHAAKDEYEAKLAAAETEAKELCDTATEQAKSMSDKILAEANRRAEVKLHIADADIAQEKKKATNEIKDEISEKSVSLAKELVGRELTEADQKRLIDTFIDTL